MRTIIPSSLAVCSAVLLSPGLRAEVSFNRDIRPVFSKNCTACHGPDEGDRKGNFRIDTYEGATHENDGVIGIVPGNAMKSEVFRRITSNDPDELMPPPKHGHALKPEEVGLIKQWINEGAKYEEHWAFVKPVKAAVPTGDAAGWARNEIDHFVARKQRELGLKHSAQADPHALLRRVSLDLTGVPPGLEEVREFATNPTPENYEKHVDGLLASPHFGEHWAAMWLDQARYADSVGYAGDEHRDIWPWRDWVIAAFNENMPFDRFTIEQIAGDLLPGATVDQKLATAFNRNTLSNNEGGTDDEEFRVIAVKDRVNTTINVWMGLTMRCAECHTHKYDPISQKEYYEFYDLFNQTADTDKNDERPKLEVAPRGRQEETVEQAKQSAPPIRVPVMEELPENKRRESHIMVRGSFLQPGEKVSGAVLGSFNPMPEAAEMNRLGVAKWLVSRDNPLTARVTVNRLWARVFGIGIVETEEDFGIQGTLPTHPELLDWLAVDFMETGWDVKAVLKKMVMSATYRQSARATADQLEIDKRNLYLARGPRMRLAAEVIRDQALVVSGLMTDRMFGEPVYPPSPVKRIVSAFTGGMTWKENTDADRYRRAVYTYLKRTSPHPLFETFDMASRDVCNLRRLRTNTPLQSFMTLNDTVFVEAAQALARKMFLQGRGDAELAVRFGLETALNAPAESAAVGILVRLYQETHVNYQDDPASARSMAGAGRIPSSLEVTDGNAAELAALSVVANVILNLDGFLTN